jgi:hypothetical protein
VAVTNADRLDEMKAIRDRLALELTDWQHLCEAIARWRAEGNGLADHASELADKMLTTIAQWDAHHRVLTERDQGEEWKP